MFSGDYATIWQAKDWPTWRFDLGALAQPLADVSPLQGLLMGRLADVGMALRDQASLLALTEDVVKTSEIEGEQLNVASVRFSIARRLGVDIGALAPAVLAKTRFRQSVAAPAAAPLNPRQAKLVNRLLDGFDGKLTGSKTN